jgi:hypothetical protein
LTVWDPHAINIANSANVHIEDVTVGPCPRCGGVGHIPDGIYSATTDTIRVIATSLQSARSLSTLLRILQRARDQRATAEDLARTLEAEPDANLKPVADLVRKLPKKLDIKAWLAIAIAVVALMEGHAADLKVDKIESRVDQIYAQMLEQHPTAAPIASPASTARRNPFPRVGRNEPCPCGSGRKYKRCHGA